MTRKLVFIANSIAAISETTYDGKAYLIAPVVAIKEQAMNGFLYLTEEFSKFVGAWDGRPISLNHPKRAGEYVSANSPDVWASEVIGQFWNVYFDKDALKGEIWIDLEKAEKIGEPATNVVERLRAGDGIEVSTGLWFDLDETPGVWNGMPYEGIARNIRPDHLALLPNEIGACSWDDGCGVPRVNQKGEDMGDEVRVNELTLDDRALMVRRAFWDQVAGVDPDGWYIGDWDVVSVFDMTLIAKDWDTKNHSAFSYTINDEGNVTFGEPVAVEVVYRAEGDGAEVVIANTNVPEQKRGLFARALHWLGAGKVEGVQIHLEDESMKKCDLVEAIIANKQNNLSKEMLDGMDEADLLGHVSALIPNEAAPAESTAQTATTPAVPAMAGLDASALTEMIQEAVNDAVAPVMETINANANREKAGLVAALVANEQCQFDEADLGAMSVAQLQKLAASLQVRDYSGGAGVILNNEGSGDYEALAMPTMNWAVAPEGSK